MEAGSIRGSIFALCTSAIGAGVLSLPYVLALNGWVFGILFIVIGAIGADWSNYMLAKRAVELNQPNYSQLCKLAGGPKLAMFLNVCILVYIFGVLISYQIIITQLFKYCINKFGVSDELSDSTEMSVYFIVPMVVFLLYPLCVKRDMSAFRYVSLLSLGALTYTAIVLIIELPTYYNHFKDVKDNAPVAFYIDWNLFTGMAMTFYSYTCQI